MSADSSGAQALGARLPRLLVDAERVAVTVAAGLHGRRRVGTGENFWQFRPFVDGDARARIDWRRTARSGRTYVRETEWEAAQTVALWRDASPRMDWRSDPAIPTKADRAGLLLLALASLLLRGGERVRLLDGANDHAAGIAAGEAALPRLAAALDRAGPGLPAALPPRHGAYVLFGDFLGPIAATATLVGRLAALPARGALVQVLDPAELNLPYAGRVRFIGVDDPREMLIGRVQSVRAEYQRRLADRRHELTELCRAAPCSFIAHATDAPPQDTLRALYEALAAPRLPGMNLQTPSFTNPSFTNPSFTNMDPFATEPPPR